MKSLLAEKPETWTVDRLTDHEIIFDTGDDAFAVLLTHAPAGAIITENQGRVVLELPESDESRMIQILLFEMDSHDDLLIDEFRDIYGSSSLPDFKRDDKGRT